MYGKIFDKLWTGSLCNAGAVVQLTFIYAIANADTDGYVELNPVPLAFLFGGCTPEAVRTALDVLTSPDPDSASSREEGRRLVREGQFLYRVVNYLDYRRVRDQESRRAYKREWMAEHRAKQKESPQVSTVDDGGRCGPIQKEKKKEKKKKIRKTLEHPAAPNARDSDSDAPFSKALAVVEFNDEVWPPYPRKRGRTEAQSAYIKARASGVPKQTILDGVLRYAEEVRGKAAEYIAHGSTWFNQKRWDDEPDSVARPSGLYMESPRRASETLADATADTPVLDTTQVRREAYEMMRPRVERFLGQYGPEAPAMEPYRTEWLRGFCGAAHLIHGDPARRQRVWSELVAEFGGVN